jgi:hypothetical protein
MPTSHKQRYYYKVVEALKWYLKQRNWVFNEQCHYMDQWINKLHLLFCAMSYEQNLSNTPLSCHCSVILLKAFCS